jgi:microcystin degradation protein MlrC
MLRQLAFIEFHQETNSFSSLTTGRREFEQFLLYFGEDIHRFADKHKAQAYGFREAVTKGGRGEFEWLPVFAAWAWSGGPIEQAVYLEFRERAVAALAEARDLAGIYLSMHGAMGVVGMRDPESDFLRAVRAVVGPDLPIVLSFDLHANVTAENVRLSSALLAYKTNPHRDHRRVGRKSGELLLRLVRNEVQPVTVFRKMRLLKGGGMGIDFLSPMRGILRRMRAMERMPKVLAVTNFWVHLWMDDEELGWSVTVTTDNDPALAERLADELCARNWEVRDHKHPEPKSVDEAIAIVRRARLLRRFGTVTLCDVSDVVGAGAPGANTNLLQELLLKAPDLRTYLPVRDPVAAAVAFAAEGEDLSLAIGGSIDPEINPVVQFTGKVCFRQQTAWGKTVVLQHQGLHVILTELPFPAYFSEDFKAVGLNLWKADITVVKNLFPFRFRFWKYNRRSIYVITNGITHLDVNRLNYVATPRPIYPLDPISDWQ